MTQAPIFITRILWNTLPGRHKTCRRAALQAVCRPQVGDPCPRPLSWFYSGGGGWQLQIAHYVQKYQPVHLYGKRNHAIRTPLHPYLSHIFNNVVLAICVKPAVYNYCLHKIWLNTICTGLRNIQFIKNFLPLHKILNLSLTGEYMILPTAMSTKGTDTLLRCCVESSLSTDSMMKPMCRSPHEDVSQLQVCILPFFCLHSWS